MASLYAQYSKERSDVDIYEDECGFFSYKRMEDGIYLEDMYIIPERRGEKLSLRYISILEQICISNGISKIFSTIDCEANNFNHSLLAALHRGFKVLSADQNIIYIIKEI